MTGAAIALAAWALLLAACDAVDPKRLASGDRNVAALASDRSVAPRQPQFPALTGRVVDRAGLLSAEEEASLTSRLAGLERRTTDQVVIVTVPSLDGRNIDDFSRALGNHWGIGQDGKDNGVLLVVASQERRTRIEVGYGLERILTNARARLIIERDMLPHFREGRFNAGIEAGAGSIIATLIAQEREPRRGRQ